MAYKECRINTKVNSGEKILKVNLKQGISTFKILSLDITPEDDYNLHTSDYGVIVGRVLANNAFGVPNVKVSVFVPISSEDEDDEIISQEYPYKTIVSTNNDNVRYNLLQENCYTGMDGKHKSVGTFPNKRRVLDNDMACEVFDKYWQYSTVTNESGDFMLFGVPTGSCQVHFDCDLSDIGLISQKPYDMINKGYAKELFKNSTEFKTDNLQNLPQILYQNTTAFVYPFWGDKKANEIGITRVDYNLDYDFEPTCIFLGSSITDPNGTYINESGIAIGANGTFNSLTTSSGNIEIIYKNEDGTISEMEKNVTGIINENGIWCYQIPMNLDRIGTDEEGNIIPISEPGKGIPTRARVRMRITLTDTVDEENYAYTAKMLIPNTPRIRNENYNPWTDDNIYSMYEFGSKTPDFCFRDLYWGKVYSIKQYIPRLEYDSASRNRRCTTDAHADYSAFPRPFAYANSCIKSIDNSGGKNPFPYTTMYAGAENMSEDETYYWFVNNLSELSSNDNYPAKGLHFCFENDWINGCLYFPKVKITERDFSNIDSTNDKLYITGRFNCTLNGLELGMDGTNMDHFKINGWDLEEQLTYYYAYKVYWNRTDIPDNAVYNPSNGRYEWWGLPVKLVWVNRGGGEENGDGGGDCGLHDRDCSHFANVKVGHGILKRVGNSKKQNVYYYGSGCFIGGINGKNAFLTLYCTDIINLGNINDIYDSLPSLYKNLPSTTVTFPPLVPPKSLDEGGMNLAGYQIQLANMQLINWTNIGGTFSNGLRAEYKTIPVQTEIADMFGYYNKPVCDYVDSRKMTFYESDKTVAENAYLYGTTRARNLHNDCQGLYWTDSVKKIIQRTGLFFGYKTNRCSAMLHYLPVTFVNTSRICELDVVNDREPNGNTWFFNSFSINGLIDRAEILTDENRRAFASMNADLDAYYIDPITGYKRFKPTPLSPVDFDGRANLYCVNRELSNYGFSDNRDSAYTRFRHGNIWMSGYVSEYVDWSGLPYQRDLPYRANSFYFYFGLNQGSSALDLFEKQYGDRKNSQDTDIRNNIAVEVDSTRCSAENGLINTISITVPESLNNANFYLYYKSKMVNYGTLYSSYPQTISGLRNGLYNFSIESPINGETINKRVYIRNLPLNLEYNIGMTDDSLEPFVKITKVKDWDLSSSSFMIDTNDETNHTIISINKFGTSSYYPYTGGTYVCVYFSEEIDRIDNGAIFFEGKPDYVECHLWLKYDTYDCYDTNFTINLRDNILPASTINNVPVSVLIPWNEKTLVWDNKNTAYPLFNVNYDFANTPIDVDTQLNYLSLMCDSIFGGNAMSAQYNGDGFFQPLCITPNMDYATYRPWGNMSKVKLDFTQLAKVDGYASISYDNPHIVGQNFVTNIDTVSLLRRHVLNEYSDNLKYQYYDNFNNRQLYNTNYFAILNDSDNLDKPVGNVKPHININRYGIWPKDEIYGMFEMQTVDKRLDYEFIMKTPAILPSGYDLFSNLKNKSIITGKLDMDVYGGFRLDYDSGKTLTSYSVVEVNNKLGEIVEVISGGPTSNAALYKEQVYEDTVEAIEDIFYGDSVTKIDELSIINNKNKNDQIKIKDNGGLSGNTSFNINLTDCNTRFSDWTVSGGKSLNVNVSYDAGIIPTPKSLDGDEDFDISYSATTKSLWTTGTLNKDGLSFMIKSDSLYNGNTYTDVNTSGWTSYNSEYSGTSWSVEGKTKELSLLVYNPMSETYKEVGLVKSFASETYNDDNVVYNTETCFFPQNKSNIPYSDSELSSMYKFTCDNIPSGVTLISNSFLMVPCRKVYQELGTNNLIKQGVVSNLGYVYFSGRVMVVKNNGLIYVYLETPLRESVGVGQVVNPTVNYSGQTLNNHTIGNISQYRCAEADDVTYDPSTCSFTITPNGTGKMNLYFIIENGLKYKVTFTN